MRRVARLFVVLVTAWSLAACSFFVSGPHEPVTPDESCDPDSPAPTIDAVIALALVAVATDVIYQDQRRPDAADTKGMPTVFVGVPLLVLSGGYGVAALYGHLTAGECRAALAKLARHDYRDGSGSSATTSSAAGRIRAARGD